MLIPFALFILALVSIVAIVSARIQAAECDLLSEGCARAHGALWIQVRNLVRVTPDPVMYRMCAIAASRSRYDARFRVLASMLASERYAWAVDHAQS